MLFVVVCCLLLFVVVCCCLLLLARPTTVASVNGRNLHWQIAGLPPQASHKPSPLVSGGTLDRRKQQRNTSGHQQRSHATKSGREIQQSRQKAEAPHPIPPKGKGTLQAKLGEAPKAPKDKPRPQPHMGRRRTRQGGQKPQSHDKHRNNHPREEDEYRTPQGRQKPWSGRTTNTSHNHQRKQRNKER